MAKNQNQPPESSLLGNFLFGGIKAAYSLCVLPIHGALYKWGDPAKKPIRAAAMKKRLPWAAGAVVGLAVAAPTYHFISAKADQVASAVVDAGGKAVDGVKKAISPDAAAVKAREAAKQKDR